MNEAEHMNEADLDMPEFGMPGPSPADWVNGAALLASGLVREAKALADTAFALRGVAMPTRPGEPDGGALADIRRQRLALSAAGDAALRATLALEAAALMGEGSDTAAQLTKLREICRRVGGLPQGLAPMLRAAALTCPSDDAAARIAAGMLAEHWATGLTTTASAA